MIWLYNILTIIKQKISSYIIYIGILGLQLMCIYKIHHNEECNNDVSLEFFYCTDISIYNINMWVILGITTIIEEYIYTK